MYMYILCIFYGISIFCMYILMYMCVAKLVEIHTHTHTQTYIYIYIYMYLIACFFLNFIMT